MELTGKAYFVHHPRTLGELRAPHLPERERPYEVVKVIRLGATDYENFTTDMLVDRQFIEDHAHLCEQAEVWRCLLVCRRGEDGGVLVLPERGGFVGWAAVVT